MSSRFCVHCGGSNPADAAFCQYCASPMAGATSGPLPTGQGAPGAPGGWAPPPYGGGGYAPPPPPQRSRGRVLLIVIVVIVAVFLVIGVISYLAAPSASGVVVTGINFESPDNVCGLNGATDTGFNASTGSSVQFTYQISGNNTTFNGVNGTAACEIHSISTNTPGFTLSGANTPLAIPANSSPLLSFSVSMPGSDYTGVLTFVLT